MIITPLTVGQLATNCYLLHDKESHECMVVDPGDAADFIEDKIRSMNLTPKLILATHGHFDHLLAAGELQAAYGIPLAVNYEDMFIVKNILKSAEYWLAGQVHYLPPNPSINIKDGDNFHLGDQEIKAIHTPGHTPGGVCFTFENEDGQLSIITGDSLFLDGYPRTDFSYSSAEDMRKSQGKITKLNPKLIYPGHGKYGDV